MKKAILLFTAIYSVMLIYAGTSWSSEIKFPDEVLAAEKSYLKNLEKHKLEYQKAARAEEEAYINKLKAELDKILVRGKVDDLDMANALHEKIKKPALGDIWKAPLVAEKPKASYTSFLVKPGVLAYEVYHGDFNKLPNFKSLKPAKQGDCSSFDFSYVDKTDFFAVRFSGLIFIPSNGDYEFSLQSDDGSALYINDKKIVDHDGVHAIGEPVKGSVLLPKGQHKIEIQFFDRTVYHKLFVKFGPKGGELKPLPFSMLMRK